MSVADINSKVSSKSKPSLRTPDSAINTVPQPAEEECRERAINAFSLEGTPSRCKRGWEATVGALDGNPLVKEILEAGAMLRQSERLTGYAAF